MNEKNIKLLSEKENVIKQNVETINLLKESVNNFEIKYNNKATELQEIHEMIS